MDKESYKQGVIDVLKYMRSSTQQAPEWVVPKQVKPIIEGMIEGLATKFDVKIETDEVTNNG